jgi:hypothetical protein
MIMAVQALAAGASDQGRASGMPQIVGATVIGTMIEWYDFLLYGTAAALVFNKLFFPSFDPFVGTLAAFGSYAVRFVGGRSVGQSSGISGIRSAARPC